MTWRSHLDGSPAHVWPEDDLIDHDLDGDDCPCGPTVEPIPCTDGSMGWVLVHHSLDGREAGVRWAHPFSHTFVTCPNLVRGPR